MIFSISRHQLSDLEKRLYYSLLLLAVAGAIVCFWGFISLFGIFLEFISLPNQSYISPEKLSTLLQSGNTAIYRFFVGGLVGWLFVDFLPRLIFTGLTQLSQALALLRRAVYPKLDQTHENIRSFQLLN